MTPRDGRFFQIRSADRRLQERGRHSARGPITCDVCHNVTGPDLDRSAQRDGLANASFKLRPSLSKVGPFPFAAPVKDNFHVSSRDPDRIAYLRSSTFCGGCHDVRVPGGGSLTHGEVNLNPGSENVTAYRLENLNTEWLTGPYNLNYAQIRRSQRRWSCGGRGSRVQSVI